MCVSLIWFRHVVMEIQRNTSSYFLLSFLSDWRNKLTGSLYSRTVRIIELTLIIFIGPILDGLFLDEVDIVNSVAQIRKWTGPAVNHKHLVFLFPQMTVWNKGLFPVGNYLMLSKWLRGAILKACASVCQLSICFFRSCSCPVLLWSRRLVYSSLIK